MRKIIIVMMLGFILTGCGDKGEEFNCLIDGKEAIFTMKDGMITSYKLDGQAQSRSVIDEINGTYFTSFNSNTEGKEALKNYVSLQGGSCSF